MGARRTIGWLAGLVALAAGPPAAAQLPPLPCDPASPSGCVERVRDLASYQVRTVYRDPSGNLITTTADGLVVVPVLVDVDHDLTTGVGGADIAVQLQIDAGRATLRVTQLPNAPAPLPLRVEAVLADPRQGSDLRVAYGFDALEDTAPQGFDATLTLAGARRVTSFALDLHTALPGSTLGVVAEVFQEGPNGERIDPQRGRLDVTPVPAVFHLGFLLGSDLGVDQSSIELATETQTVGRVLLQDIQGNHERRLDAVVDRVPNALSLLFTSGTDRRVFNYRATQQVGVIDIRATDWLGGALQDELLRLHLEDMALNAVLIQDSPTHATFQASSPIGVVEAGLASGGPARFLPDEAYLYADDSGGVDSLSFRVLGLEAAEVGSGDPFVIGATLRAGPFRVLVIDGTLRIDATIQDLPHQFRIQASPSAGTVDYSGSAVVGRLEIDATNPAGISGRASRLWLLLRDIPTELHLSFGQAGTSATLDAGGQTLGLIEVLLTSGPDERLDPSVDGLLLKDLADRYVVFARVTGLRRVQVTGGDAPQFRLETTGGRVLRLDLNQQSGSKVVYTRATLDSLPPTVEARLAGQTIAYTASAPARSLTFDTNSGSRWNLHAEMRDPLPASFSLCTASNISCVTVPGETQARAGSASFRASEHTTINLFDCVAPADASCPSSPRTYTRISNLRVRVFETAADSDDIGFAGYIFENTSGFSTSGEVRVVDGDFGFRQVMPSGFWADNRKGKWTFWGLFGVTKTGTVNCPPGTALEATVFGFTLNVTGFLC